MLRAVRTSLGFMTRSERLKFIILVVGRTLSGLLDVVGIALIGVIAAVGTAQLDSKATSAGPIEIAGVQLPFSGPYTLLWLAIIVLVVFVGKSFLAVILTRRLAFLIASVEARNAIDVARLLLYGSLDESNRYSKAEYQFTITGSMTAAFTSLLNSIAIIISEGFLLILICGSFFFVDPVAAVFALIYFAAVAVVIQLVIGRSLKRAGRAAAEGSIMTNSLISDSLDTFRELSVLGKQELYINRMHDARTRLSQSSATTTFLSGMPRYVIETALIVGVVVLVAQQLTTNGLVSGVATLGVFLTGGTRIMASLLPLQNSVGQIKTNVEQSRLAHTLLTEHHELQARASTRTQIDRAQFGAAGLSVDIQDADFAYPGSDVKALNSISLTADPGEFVAIIGPSGAGKTTLVDMLLGLVPGQQGTVRIGGADPLDVRSSLPGLVSYVPQRPGMVSGTIAENIALGVAGPDIDRARLSAVVRSAYLEDFIAGLPDGIDTSVGKQSNALSGGQVQRIGLARALYTQPKLLIMDEATSALDAASEAFISESLRELHGSVTVIVIAHRLSTVQHADDVYLIESGHVTARGDFQTLTATVPTVAEYVKLMSFDEVAADD